MSTRAGTSVVVPDGIPADQVDQARHDLGRYAAAHRAAGDAVAITVTGALIRQEGDWEAELAGADKEALAANAVVIARAAEDSLVNRAWPSQRVGPASIAWGDGTATPLRAMSPVDASLPLWSRGGNSCGCTPLQVVDAQATTTTVATTRGDAVVPAWRYALAGTRVTLLVAALPAEGLVRVEAPAWDPDNPPPGMSIDGVVVRDRDADLLTASFTGSPGTADEPCGADYTAAAVESDLAVVVLVLDERQERSEGQVCAAIGAVRTAQVHLARPLGTRAVLEVREGHPVAVRITGGVTSR